MPELPEVETARRTLEQLVVGKTIEHITVRWHKIIKFDDGVEAFINRLKGQTFRSIGRKGKFLLFYLDGDVLVSHLRMEGKFSVKPEEEPSDKHTHVIFQLTNGEQLRYNDVRKFGTMHLFTEGQENDTPPLTLVGPEPFDESFTLDYFKEKVQRSSRMIKNILLDQTVVAGLGNIYVDETLFKAGVHPERRGNSMQDMELVRIQQAAAETLLEAVEKGGSTIRSYVNSQGKIGTFQQQLLVYGQNGTPCPNCGREIIKIKVGGRGTHICTSCQK